MSINPTVPAAFGVALALFILLASGPVGAHCDAMDGPVVTEAKAALEEGEVTPVLKWIPEENEEEIREVFAKTLRVREHGGEAREVADKHFFETLVRHHRASEGAPFTGLKPAGTEVHPVVEKSDAALETGSVDAFASEVATAVEEGIRERFAEAAEAQARKDESVDEGRAFVERYVEFIHYVKGIHETVAGSGHGHGAEEASEH